MKVSVTLSNFLPGSSFTMKDEPVGTKVETLAHKGIGGLLGVLKATKDVNFEDIRKRIKITKVVMKDGAEHLQGNLDYPVEVDTELVIYSNFKEVLTGPPPEHENKHFKLVFENDVLSYVQFRNQELWEQIQSLTDHHRAFNTFKNPVKAEDLYQVFRKLSGNIDGWRVHWSDWTVYDDFVAQIKVHFEKEKARVEDILKKNNGLKFEHLPMYFSPGDHLLVKDWERDALIGGVCKTVDLKQSVFGQYVRIEYEIVQTTDVGFHYTTYSHTVSEYSGVKTLEELPVRHLNDKDTLEMLTDRGSKFSSYGMEPNHVFYKGPMYYRQWIGMDQKHVDSRIMVDVVSFNRSNPNYHVFKYRNNNQSEKFNTVREADYWRCAPTVPAFCLSTMRWGEVLIERLEDIKFNEDALNRLVLPDERKEIIKALVSHPPNFKDIVDGKSQGRIFLLHGPPGVGKTSSAEAVAEVLKLPLYKFTSGQLGVNPTELDSRLRDRLMIADRWKAIILLDEADIYLERRKDSDVLRNAMVSIFLNLLEYHQGVLFLTTNRVTCFDEAFQSRINLTLHYDEFGTDTRRKVWLKQFSSAGLDLEPRPEWVAKNMNGRQIGNCIRMAMSIALSKNENVTLEHVDTAMSYC